jgi:hypothetical protein
MKDEIALLHMRILVKVINSFSVKQGTASLDAMYNIAFLKQILSKICSVLACNTGD